VAALVALAAMPAWGHAVLVRSSPQNRAQLSQPPARVELWFNERIEPAYARLTVEADGGARVDRADVTVGPEDARKVSVTLGSLPAGRYTVRYRVLSVDGHIVESQLTFTVRGR
jgi:methionine-rich copper-binding protein CopC